MKGKFIAISLYILLVIIVCAIGAFWFFAFAFNDVLNYYYGGILKLIFILTMIVGIVLPIIKYRKYEKKYILPMVLCIMMLITAVFNNGILKFVEDDLSIFSREKWEKHRNLRIYMLDNLEAHYIYKGNTEDDVRNLLGKPDYATGKKSQRYEYFVSPGYYVDPVIFYVEFENGLVVGFGKYHS